MPTRRLLAKLTRLRLHGAVPRDRLFDRLYDALDWYRRGTESDELAEALYRGQMRVLRATGRAAEAMSTYRRLRQLLSVVLGIAPSEQTQALARAIQEETASVGNR